MIVFILALLFVLWAAYLQASNQSRYKFLFDKLLEFSFLLITCFVLLIACFVIYILFSKSIEFFNQASFLNFLFSLDWDPQSTTNPSFGLFPLLNGTLLVMLIAMTIGAPLGILSAIFLSEFCSRKFQSLLKPFIELIAGIPTVVFGYFAIIFVAPLIKNLTLYFSIQSSLENALVAGVVMGVMITPYIVSLTYDILQDIPNYQREASMALGATKSETIIFNILPTAKHGIIAVMILAVSRTIGETMIVTMAAGLTPQITANPFQSVTTITSQIVNLLSGDQEFDSPQVLVAFVLAASLFIITFYINSLAQRIMYNFRSSFK